MINFCSKFRYLLSSKTYEKIMKLWNVFCMLFNQFQKVLVFILFLSSWCKIYSLQNISVNTIPKANFNSINTNCIKGVLFWKIKNIGTVSNPEVIFRSLQLHAAKCHKKGLFSQMLVCCYVMALLFLEMLRYCCIRKVSVSKKFFYPALFWFVQNCFELIFFYLTLLLILYMDVNSHAKSVMNVGFREQINHMKFMKLCILIAILSTKAVS